jgi:hypothetical protein
LLALLGSFILALACMCPFALAGESQRKGRGLAFGESAADEEKVRRTA